MKAKSFKQFLHESVHDEMAQRHQEKRRLQDLGLADSPLDQLEEMLVRRRWKYSKNSEGGFQIELTRWEAESTYLSRMGARHQKKYPNTYVFDVTEFGAEPGKVRILWFSSKDGVKEESVEANPEQVIRKIDQLFSERSVN
jgi:hypothetical protein